MTTLAGRYEVTETLGGGGFAITYLARDIMQPSKPLCVVKQLRPNQTSPRIIDFFKKEAAILEKLGKHPQIPQLLAHFEQDNNLYIVQEFIQGHDLSQEISPGKRLSENYVRKLLEDVLEVLSFVHKYGVIHRDIKPQNLMRRQEDGKIFLIDFGAVKELGSLMVNSQGEVTSSVVIGTSGYMPSEQGNGKPRLASDVYAVGMSAIAALTGIQPHELEENPGGEFLMGSPLSEKGRENNESPQHRVTVKSFFMGKFTVTQAQYQAIMGKNHSYFKGEKRPVELVSWNDAREFCKKLTEKTGRTYRLPSEAEWEYACRARTTTPFNFGETITTDLANYNGHYTYADAPKGEYRRQTTEVGSFPPNAFGLYDMHGNVWEWCEDTYQRNYNGAPTDGSAWIENNNRFLRVLRGGSWYDNPLDCRSAYRGYLEPYKFNGGIGLRVVCAVVPRNF